MNSAILDVNARVTFFPVRHHSPACARGVAAFIEKSRPDIVLIEGPSDFNERVDELGFDHQLPIAIYSWAARNSSHGGAEVENRRGAFYPFCVYSPEWQALQSARNVGAMARFIDLPWSAFADETDAPANRYAQPELRGSDYVAALCAKLGAPDMDALWDRLFEIDDLDAQTIWERCHHFCYGVRAENPPPARDLRRESFMAARIRDAMDETDGRIFVVTGGFHSYALWARINGEPFDGNANEDRENLAHEAEITRGLALTPYSYERLDSLIGYEAGMPSPGFYDAVWTARANNETREIGRDVLARTVRVLRKRKQIASSADVIAALATARGLANLRGHSQVWRRDLVDGVIGALVKDELSGGVDHPFLDAIYAALRGDAHGKISDDAPRAPLVADVQLQLEAHDLEVEAGQRKVDLDLAVESDLARSRVLHRVRVTNIAGFEKVGGSDFVARADLAHARETWKLSWTPETMANAVEASIYGATLREAARAKLGERAARIERESDVAALLLLDCALAGLRIESATRARLIEIVRGEGDFFRLAGALEHLLFTFHFDDWLGARGDADFGAILRESWERGVWLLETLGTPQNRDKELIAGLSSLVRALQRCENTLALDRELLLQTLKRIGESRTHDALLRGAATGARWTLGAIESGAALAPLPTFAEPQQLGDFLTGLFALAREAAQRQSDLVGQIDALLGAFGDEQFLEALPSLRLAFSYFTPREKHYMALTLMEGKAQPLADLVVGVEVAARAMRMENRVFDELEKYGLRV